MGLRLTNSNSSNGRIRIWLNQPGSNDPDAQAFINAAGITDPTQQSAINTLVVDLKAQSLWTKFNAIYPFVGGTATTHKFNLKDPRDLDAAFRLNFVGGWTHSSNGATPNGTNGYADTFLNANTILTLNSTHIMGYIRNNVAENVYDMGAGVDPSSYICFSARNTLNIYRILVNTGTISDLANSDSRGMFTATRTSSTAVGGFKNATKIHNLTQSSNSKPNKTIYIGALNFTTPTLFSSKQFAFSSIGDGLSDADVSNYYNIVQTYQTTLNRQV